MSQYTRFPPDVAVTSFNGVTGPVNLVAGTNITITPSGNTFTIAATSGGGTILALPSNPGGAGYAVVVFVVPGLLATDTILSVCAQTQGAVVTAAVVGFSAQGNNTLTVQYSADPGGLEVVLVAVKR